MAVAPGFRSRMADTRPDLAPGGPCRAAAASRCVFPRRRPHPLASARRVRRWRRTRHSWPCSPRAVLSCTRDLVCADALGPSREATAVREYGLVPADAWLAEYWLPSSCLPRMCVRVRMPTRVGGGSHVCPSRGHAAAWAQRFDTACCNPSDTVAPQPHAKESTTHRPETRGDSM